MRFDSPEWLDAVPSTNTLLRERLLAAVSTGDGCVLAARHQTAGRGRFDRSWQSGPGRDLAFSFVLALDSEQPDVSALAMAVALGVRDLLSEHGICARTKWPNDVLVGPNKICGILSELCSRPGLSPVMIVGVGLNVNMSACDAGAIGRPSTSLVIETGHEHDPAELLGTLLRRLEKRITTWQDGGFAAIRQDWLAHCAYLGEKILIEDGAHLWQGVLRDFGAGGELILALPDGTEKHIWSGDVVRARPLPESRA